MNEEFDRLLRNAMPIADTEELCAYVGAIEKELAVLREGLNDRVKVEQEIRAYGKNLDEITPYVLRDWADRLGIPEEYRK